MMATDDLDMMALPDELSGSDQDGVLLMAEDEDIGVDEEKLAVKKEKLVIPKKGPNGKPTKKTKVQAGSSNPTTSTPAWPSSKKPKNIMERFSEVTKIEEEMAQKQLELKKFQVKSSNEVAVASIQAKMHLRVERDRRKAELMMQKSKQDHEFCMAQLQTGNPTLAPPPQPNCECDTTTMPLLQPEILQRGRADRI